VLSAVSLGIILKASSSAFFDPRHECASCALFDESAVDVQSQPIQERNIQRRTVNRVAKRGSLCPTFFVS
jgi:hypothetical protein